jgi:hypothetical protein
MQDQNLLDRVIMHYKSLGYTVEVNFPGEYLFLFNPDTGEKVRLYENGRVIES